MRLLLDEMYPRSLAERLRRTGHDVVAVVERSELVGRPDLDIARSARDDDRVVVTENVADFLSLGADDRGGLLLLNARRWPRTPRGIVRIGDALEAWLDETRDEQTAAVQWLSDVRPEPGTAPS